MQTSRPRTLLYRFGVYAVAAGITGWFLPVAGLFWFAHLVLILMLLFKFRRFARYGRLAGEQKPTLFVWVLIIYFAGQALEEAGTRYFDRSDRIAYADLQKAQGIMPAAAAYEPGSKVSSAYDYFPFHSGSGNILRLRCTVYPTHTDNCQAAYAHAGSDTLIRYHQGVIYEMQANGRTLLAYDTQLAAFRQQLTAERRRYGFSLLGTLLVYTLPLSAFTLHFGRLWQQTPPKEKVDFEAASRQAARPLPQAQHHPADRREDARFLTLTQRNRRANALGITIITIPILLAATQSPLHLAGGLLILLPLCYGFWQRYRHSPQLSYRAADHCFLFSRWENGQQQIQMLPADAFRGVLLRRLPEQLCQLVLLAQDGREDVLIDKVEGHLFGKPGQLARLQQHIHRASGLPVLSDGSFGYR